MQSNGQATYLDSQFTGIPNSCRKFSEEDVHRNKHQYFDLPVGVDCNVKTAGGWTPLMCAATDGHLQVVKVLLQRGWYSFVQ